MRLVEVIAILWPVQRRLVRVVKFRQQMARPALVLLLVGLFAACQPDSTRSPQRIRASVDSLLAAYESSMNSGTVDDLMSVYSSDERFLWVEDGEVV